MRRTVQLGALLAALLAPPGASASLHSRLAALLHRAGPHTGALVVDADTGRTLFSDHARTGRMPASVEKLWTTSTALRRLGPDATFVTRVYTTGDYDEGRGIVHGDLVLRGGGDPTFGLWGAGRLAADVREAGVRRVTGRVRGDESLFDTRRGVPSSGYRLSPYVEPLSALAYRRDYYAGRYVTQPALQAAAALTLLLKDRGIRTGHHAAVGRLPAGAQEIAELPSPRLSTLLAWTNAPSDNFYAEMLLKDIGARLGAGGTTVAGAGVVHAEAASLGLHPRVYDGSGLSRADRSSPAQVVSLLRDMRDEPVFTRSLAVAGRTGTLEHRMRRTAAATRCRGKTGTLRDASNLAGYCTLRGNTRVAFAILMNGVSVYYARALQDRMLATIAAYRASSSSSGGGGGAP